MKAEYCPLQHARLLKSKNISLPSAAMLPRCCWVLEIGRKAGGRREVKPCAAAKRSVTFQVWQEDGIVSLLHPRK